MKLKQFQIDENLLYDICMYFQDKEKYSYLEEDIKNRLDEKVDRIIARELFTKYKTSASCIDREQARIEYLDHKMIPESFRGKF